MNRELSPEATELGGHARRALTGTASDAAACEAALGALGAWELDVHAGADELEAAAAICHAAGWCATPYPVAERLAPLGDHVDGAITIVLPCWTLLGMLDRAVDLACRHVRQREQFGRPLADLQGVQFMLTEAEVERAGVDELARYALWSIETARPEMLEDALALRVAAIDAARVVFRVAHQVHGASGFCDDTELSWLSRRSEPLRREPLGGAATLAALTARTDRRGITGLFTGETARRS